ncbi:MAG: 3'-5' exonuclease [Opitutales bacterium]|nr:3'-5' exonuclease [Opitutales bacterium]
MDFTAIDFETANAGRASVCEVGLVRVEGGRVAKEIRQLIDPRAPFGFYNTVVHGITAFDVRGAPTFGEFFGEMSPYLKGVVVAHNAAFDISCLRAELERYEIPEPDFNYACTLCMSRRVGESPSNKLDALARFYGLGEFNHHDALADASICARLFEILSEKIDFSKIEKPFRRSRPQRRAGKARRFSPRLSAALAGENFGFREAPQFDYSPIEFCGKSFFVFGNFGGMSVREIEGLILREGGAVLRELGERADYAIVGDSTDESRLREIFEILPYTRARLVRQSHFLRQI